MKREKRMRTGEMYLYGAVSLCQLKEEREEITMKSLKRQMNI